MTRREMTGLGLLGVALGAAVATPSAETEPDAKDLEERCRREVLELHRFFQDWFNGELEPTDESFERFAAVIEQDFVIISPEGRISARGPLLEGLRGAHGRWKETGGGKIRIENFRLHRAVGGEFAVVTYEEWQDHGGEVKARLSTGFFGRRAGTPNGVVWLHLHEVWMPSS